MAILTKEQRNQLERVVLKARDIAEIGAAKALHTLGVGDPDPPAHLNSENRLLRRALRAQARQLGDSEDHVKKGYYTLPHLTEKVGYDQWHRMLFARFLAENDLLVSQRHGVAVSLEDCLELAPELGLRDGWEVAANFASKMLPQIFRSDDPAGKIHLAPEDLNALEKQLADLGRDTFLADDSLGWVYQFWQAKRKDEVNASGNKIGADELASVTQLFTEDYMVQFLLHNTLGAWWAGKNMHKEGIVANTEEEARAKVALPGVGWEYLRFVRDDTTEKWKPAAGIFPGWPRTAKELRVLDPCMGSGHFLAVELLILAAMRIVEEGFTKSEAVVVVLRDNLFGLEIDSRCTQIAAFNLALSAWKLGGFKTLPQLNLACSGLGIYASRESWSKLANGNAQLRWGMERLYDLFKDAPVLGSLIDPTRLPGTGFNLDFNDLQPLLNKVLLNEEIQRDDDIYDLGVTAEGVAHAAEILSNKFHLIATNVPYLGKRKQNNILLQYCKDKFPNSDTDLATCFLERCIGFCHSGSTTALVTPQNWQFLGTYQRLRKHLLKTVQWDFVARLGPRAFETIGGEVVNVVLISLTQLLPYQNHSLCSLDVDEAKLPSVKKAQLISQKAVFLNQSDQLRNPDARIAFIARNNMLLLEHYAYSAQGIGTTDNPRFVQSFWEQQSPNGEWEMFQASAMENKLVGGCSSIFRWGGPGSEYFRHIEALKAVNRIGGGWQAGGIAWGQRGFAVNVTHNKNVTLYSQGKFDTTVGMIIPRHPDNLLPIYAFLRSTSYTDELRKIDPTLSVTEGTLVKVPFDIEYWQKIAAEQYPEGLPKPHSNDSTQWIFIGNPKYSEQPLQVAVARLMDYHWPRQTGSSFPDCPSLGLDGLENHSDKDGIVCLHGSKNESSAAERLRALLADAYGNEWTNDKQTELLKQVGSAGKTLEEWLRNGFFEQHCQLFQQRPFIWQIWDGIKNGFNVLVNYHKLNRTNLEKVTYSHLGDWISKQKSAVEYGEEGSDARLTAAQELQRKLQLILEGEPPYDIFIRWKPLEKQPIGWEPDLNDGVRLNIRPFMTASVLRKNPKINWNKDRGTDVVRAPWYSMFKGERINDFHLTLEEKKKARNK